MKESGLLYSRTTHHQLQQKQNPVHAMLFTRTIVFSRAMNCSSKDPIFVCHYQLQCSTVVMLQEKLKIIQRRHIFSLLDARQTQPERTIFLLLTSCQEWNQNDVQQIMISNQHPSLNKKDGVLSNGFTNYIHSIIYQYTQITHISKYTGNCISKV